MRQGATTPVPQRVCLAQCAVIRPIKHELTESVIGAITSDVVLMLEKTKRLVYFCTACTLVIGYVTAGRIEAAWDKPETFTS